MLVIDASVTMAWCFQDEETQAARDLLRSTSESGAHVPSLWWHEVANVLHVATRRGRMPVEIMREKIQMLNTLPLIHHPADRDRVFGSLIALARAQDLTVYDASYLDLAMLLRVKLATRDKALAAAAVRTGVELVPC